MTIRTSAFAALALSPSLLVAFPAAGYSLLPGQDFRVGSHDAPITAAAVGDLNGDGRDDVVLAAQNRGMENYLFVRLQMSDGSLSAALEASLPAGGPSDLVISDLDGDGLGEVISGHHTGLVITRVVSGSLDSSRIDHHANGMIQNIAISDIDRDGHPDVFTGGMPASSNMWQATVFFGDGQGNIGRQQTLALPLFEVISEVLAADLDLDGYTDIVLRAGVDRAANDVHLLYNDGSDDLSPVMSVPVVDNGPWSGSSAAATGDFNNDGHIDIASSSHSDIVSVLTWSQGGGYLVSKSLSTSGDPRAMAGTDMDGDGRDDLLMLKGDGSVVFRLQAMEGLGVETVSKPPSYPSVPSWSGEYGLATGDINGDGCVDVVVANYHAAYTVRLGSQCAQLRDDYNGDGTSDIVWRHRIDGHDQIWLAARSGDRQRMRAVRNVEWDIVASGDFDGDGASDVFWRNVRTGANALWPSAAPTRTPVRGVANGEWLVEAAGDFDGDGRDDLFWRNMLTGVNAVWPGGHPGDVQVVAVRNHEWHVAGAGDFDGDGVDDVFWRNPYTGENVIWRSALYATQQVVEPMGEGWTVAGIGDFGGDATDDVLWRNHETGENVLWLGANASEAVDVADVTNTSWIVAAVGDYDGDGDADILWRDRASGRNVIWRDANPREQRAVGSVSDQDWEIVPTTPVECDASRAQWAIGRTYGTGLGEEIRSATRARTLRAEPDNLASPDDYVDDRVRIGIDSDDGRVWRVTCG